MAYSDLEPGGIVEVVILYGAPMDELATTRRIELDVVPEMVMCGDKWLPGVAPLPAKGERRMSEGYKTFHAFHVFKQGKGADIEPGWYAMRQRQAVSGSYPFGPVDGPHKTRRDAEKAGRRIALEQLPDWWTGSR